MPFRFSRPLLPSCFVLLVLGCAGSAERLPRLDRQFYENLENDADRQEFLTLKEAERQSFLERKGIWSKWKELSAAEREAVSDRRVEIGHREFTAHMAWGPPADVKTTDARGRNVRFETFIRCTSGPNFGHYVRQNSACDGTSQEVQLAMENGIVTEIKHLD